MGSLECFSVMALVLTTLAPLAHAFDMAGNIYRISGEINSGSGNATALNFRAREIAAGSLSGMLSGGIYTVFFSDIIPLPLSYLLISPAFNPGEVLVIFWRK